MDLLGERGDGGCFVVLNIKDGVKLGDLEQVMNLLGEVQQLQFAALVADCGVGADQLTDARAVDVVDVAEVQQNKLCTLREQVTGGVAELNTAFAEGNASA